jgi:hypothetical protein
VVIRPRFDAHDDGSVAMRLPSWLRALLREQFDGFVGYLGHGSVEATGDPLEELTGIRSGPVSPPDDAVLRRLRPDAYAADVEGGRAAQEFRRFTESDLAALQRQRVESVRETLVEGDKVLLSPGQAQDWLGALNDLRLALGTALDVPEDPADTHSEGDDLARFEFYSLLSHLQYLLLVALGAPPDPGGSGPDR